MILVRKAPAGYFAQLYFEDEVVFDTKRETDMEYQRNAGNPAAKPCPPHTHYGPGGDRYFDKTFADVSGEWTPTAKGAIEKLLTKKNRKSILTRIDRAERKLAYERARLKAFDSSNRTFDGESGEEINV